MASLFPADFKTFFKRLLYKKEGNCLIKVVNNQPNFSLCPYEAYWDRSSFF